MKVIAVVNQKNIVGKHTTVLALSIGFVRKNFKVLCIEANNNGSLGYSLGANIHQLSLYEVLTGQCEIKQAIQPTCYGFDLIPSSSLLAEAQIYMSKVKPESILRNALQSIADEYQYVFIDTPPAMGIITINVLTACDSIVISAHADIDSLTGIEQLFYTIKPVKEYYNPELHIEAILLTKYNPQESFSRSIADMTKQLASQLRTNVLHASVREGIPIKEAQLAAHAKWLQTMTKATITDDYHEIIQQLLLEDE